MPANALSLMVVMLEGMTRVRDAPPKPPPRLVQPWKAEVSIVWTPVPRLRETRPVQPWKTPVFRIVTPLGIVSGDDELLVRPEQPLKALLPRVVRLVGRVRAPVRPVQP